MHISRAFVPSSIPGENGALQDRGWDQVQNPPSSDKAKPRVLVQLARALVRTAGRPPSLIRSTLSRAGMSAEGPLDDSLLSQRFGSCRDEVGGKLVV